jgi:hypothetical protein
MKRRLAILVLAVLTAAGASACGKDDKENPPTTVAPPPVESAGVTTGPSGGAPAAGDPAATATAGGGTEPAGQPGTAGAPGRPGTTPKVRRVEVGKTVSSFGIGPYEVGVTQATLKKAKLVGAVTVKNGCGTGTGTAEFQKPTLTFSAGRLQRIAYTGKTVFTIADAKVGTKYADLKRMYPKGKELTDYNGASGWLVTEGAHALLFRIEDGKVSTIVAGEAGPVQVNFTDNQPC